MCKEMKVDCFIICGEQLFKNYFSANTEVANLNIGGCPLISASAKFSLGSRAQMSKMINLYVYLLINEPLPVFNHIVCITLHDPR